ncbi:hypothetical protein QBC38DRAFT_529622 [Podospora fimiseda]|uniref:Tyrosinase n=1 Tax=Podospora fimiseda TaxID=252190 RepID=A0AAN7BM97_9PEZI|nr:hypothetical protein QBC38DRAFT_529622 [Podospora fimiseda]
MTLFQLLAGVTLLITPSLSAPAEAAVEVPNWWTTPSFSCPLWKGTVPNGYQDLVGSKCYNNVTKTYTGGRTTARLYQIPGAWQRNARYSEIVNGAGDAIKKGLSSFGSLVSSPLAINIGIAWGGLGEIVKVDDDNSGQKTPCYVLINFPPDWNDVPLQVIQKDIIGRMYQCVEQFHRPTVTTWTDGNKWWRRGIARYFDGLSYPAKPGEFLTEGLYPEEYHYGIPLYQNSDAASLFFHFADQLGTWSLTDVHNWMKTHPNKANYDDERASLSIDTKITPFLWHRFILASIDGTIRYPTGLKITNTQGGVPSRTQSGTVDLAVGGSYSRSVSISSFKGGINVFTVKQGQTLKVTVETELGVEWSIRKLGTTAWNSGSRTRTVDLVVGSGQGTVKYQIAISSTKEGGGYPAKVGMKRSA